MARENKKQKHTEKNEYVTVKKSNIHGKGCFAKKDIEEGTYIIQYKGEKITKREAEIRGERDNKRGTVYLFNLNKRYDIDGWVNGNEAKYINHSSTPNCEAVNVSGKEIWIVGIRDIKKGEELTYDYGFELEDDATKNKKKN
jgi:SET domain-containing protein